MTPFEKAYSRAYSQDPAKRTEALRGLREKYGSTQAEIAKLFNVSIRTVQGWEGKRQTPAPITAILSLLDEREELKDLLEYIRYQST